MAEQLGCIAPICNIKRLLPYNLYLSPNYVGRMIFLFCFTFSSTSCQGMISHFIVIAKKLWNSLPFNNLLCQTKLKIKDDVVKSTFFLWKGDNRVISLVLGIKTKVSHLVITQLKRQEKLRYRISLARTKKNLISILGVDEKNCFSTNLLFL